MRIGHALTQINIFNRSIKHRFEEKKKKNVYHKYDESVCVCVS